MGQQALFMQRSPDARRGLIDRTLYMEEAAFARSMPRINRAQVLVAFSVCSWGCTALCAMIRKASGCKGRYLTGYRLLYWRCLLITHDHFFVEFYR